MPKYLISMRDDCGNVLNKIVSSYENRHILRAAKAAFKVTSDCVLEWYDEDLHEYGVLDDPEKIPSGGKARLIQLVSQSVSGLSSPLSSATAHSIATADTVLVFETPAGDGALQLRPFDSSTR